MVIDLVIWIIVLILVVILGLFRLGAMVQFVRAFTASARCPKCDRIVYAKDINWANVDGEDGSVILLDELDDKYFTCPKCETVFKVSIEMIKGEKHEREE